MKEVLTFQKRKFGHALNYFRKSQELTLRQAQEQTGIHYQVISLIERGERQHTSSTILLAFWADLDLRDYVEVNLINPDTKDLFEEPIRRTAI